MLTLALIGIPFIASLVLFASRGNNLRNFALAVSVVEFGLAAFAWFTYSQNPASELLAANYEWIDSLGIRFDVSLSALNLLMVILTTFLVPLIILSSFKKGETLSNNFYALILMMQMALVGVFMANDGFLFYVFWEVALIPIYFILLLWGGKETGKITLRFFIYTFFGSLFMLIGLIYLYNHSGGITGIKSWNVQDLYAAGQSLTAKEQNGVFWAIFLAFAIKLPIFPFHTWQPETYYNAPTQGTMLLSGIMLKMASFGLIKWLLPMVPLGFAAWGNFALILCVIGVIYASLIAINQTEFKRLIAYSSIAHVAVLAAGAMSLNQQGIQGSIMFMLAHGVNAVGLFFIVELLRRHAGTSEMDKLGGIRSLDGTFAVYFLIILLGSVALPMTNGFVGEFLSFSGLYQYSPWMTLFAGLSVILGAVYMLRAYQRIMLGEVREGFTFGKLETTEKVTLAIICAAVIIMGVYPAPLNEMAEAATQEILTHIK